MIKMTIKKLVLSLFPFFLLFLFANIAAAQEDFTASALPAVELCPCSNQGYAVTVQNTGSIASSYTIVAAGDVAGWVKFVPNKFVLQPGEAGSLNAVVNSICNVKGDFDLEIYVTTNNGLTKLIKQTLKINECYDYSLGLGKQTEAAETISYMQHDGPYKLCADEQKAIPILITNNEDFGNEYRLFLDAPEWAGLNLEKARLDAKQSGVVLVNYDSSGILGDFDFKLGAISSLGNVQRKLSLDVNVGKCYELDVRFEKQEAVCGGEATEYNTVIKNKGTIPQKVDLELEGPEWASLGNITSFRLEAGQERKIKLRLAPEEDVSGTFVITVDAVPDNKTRFKASNTINLDVSNKAACYRADISTKAAVTNLYKGDFFFAKVTNNGIKKANYKASLEGPSWASLSPQALELNPEQAGNLNIKINPSDGVEPNTYGLKINIESNGAFYSKNIDIKLRKETGLEKSLKATLKAYQYYFYLLIAIIILILIFIKPIIRGKNNIKYKYKKYKIKKERLRALKLARLERKKQKEKEEKRIEKQTKKEAKKRKESEYFRKYKAWIYSFFALAVLILLGDYFKLYNLKYTHIYLRNIFIGYLYYILIGVGAVVVLFLLVLLYNHLSKRKKKPKKEAKKKIEEKAKESKEAKKAEKAKKGKRWYNKPLYVVIILALLIALIISIAYFNFFNEIKDFAVLYSYYFALGIVMLIIIIGILSFYKPAVKMFKE